MTVWDGGGTDTYDLSAYTTNLSINLTPGGSSLFSAAQRANLDAVFQSNHYALGNVFNALLYQGDTRSLIENATGGSGNDLMIGNQADNTLTGNGGNDFLLGDAGNDSLIGGSGLDSMTGGTGDDTYFVDASGDIIVETSGGGTADRVLASASFALAADADIEVLATTDSTGVTVINLTGNALAQSITGNAADNSLSDGGAAGRDTMAGGSGNDTYRVHNSADVIDEILGNGTADTLIASVNFILASDDDIEVMATDDSAGTTPINLRCNALAQLITSNAGANILNDGGKCSADTLMGGGGNDFYIVHNSGARIDEVDGQGTADKLSSSVSFVLAADDSIEVLTTLAATPTAAINLTGNGFAHRIVGDDAANVLNGLGGNDTMIGGLGADTFVFSTAPGPDNLDRINDFNPVDDVINLDHTLFGNLATGILDATRFVISTVGQAVDDVERIIYNPHSGALYFDPDGTGSASRVQFAWLSHTLALSNADFVQI